jgi:hypothetical protein
MHSQRCGDLTFSSLMTSTIKVVSIDPIKSGMYMLHIRLYCVGCVPKPDSMFIQKLKKYEENVMLIILENMGSYFVIGSFSRLLVKLRN